MLIIIHFGWKRVKLEKRVQADVSFCPWGKLHVEGSTLQRTKTHLCTKVQSLQIWIQSKRPGTHGLDSFDRQAPWKTPNQRLLMTAGGCHRLYRNVDHHDRRRRSGHRPWRRIAQRSRGVHGGGNGIAMLLHEAFKTRMPL